MKIPTQNLKSSLSALAPTLRKSQSITNTHRFRLEAKADLLFVVADDLDQRIVASAACDGEIEPHCVSGKHLTSLTEFANGEISLELNKGRLCFKSGDMKAELPTVPHDEFPKSPESKLTAQGVNCKDLAEMIKRVAWAASDDTKKMALCSVAIRANEKTISVCATNAKLVAKCEKAAISSQFTLLIPDEMSEQICFALQQDEAKFLTSENRISVQHKTGEYSCRMIEGNWPWQFFDMTKETGITWEVPRQPLYDAMAGICAIASESDNMVDANIHANLEFGPKGLWLHSNDKSGQKFEADIAGKFEEKNIAVAAKQLFRLLPKFSGDTVKIELMNDGNVIRIQEGDFSVMNQLVRLT